MAEAASPIPAARRHGKSESAFRTISEVATDLGLPQHVLRFWETKFAQIRPLKRGGGRRYYRPEDVTLLKRIRSLLYEDGYTIRGVQKLLKENGGKVPAAEAEDEMPFIDAPPVPRAPVDPPPSGLLLSSEQRAELQALIDELEDLRLTLRRAIE